ncbi:MAG: ATP-dependent protease La domain-containing protein [Balneolaceae bacterium]|nr:MAG: ATP-dependent protease La domain-containing protein [Balneolaceae bacterium]
MKKIPIFPLQLVLFPGEKLPLHIFEPRYKDMLAWCLSSKSPFGVSSFIKNQISRIGCIARLDTVEKKYDDGRMDIICTGTDRFRIKKFDSAKSFLQGDIESFNDMKDDAGEKQLKMEQLVPLFRELMLLASQETLSGEVQVPAQSYGFAHLVGFELAQKQKLLEMRSEQERLQYIHKHIRKVLPQIKAFEEVRRKIRSNGHFRTLPPLSFNIDE